MRLESIYKRYRCVRPANLPRPRSEFGERKAVLMSAASGPVPDCEKVGPVQSTESVSRKLETLADCGDLVRFCIWCGCEFPASTPVRFYETGQHRWIVADCPLCQAANSFRVE